MDLAKHTILNNSFRDAKMPGGPQVSKTSRYAITASPVERQGSIPKSCKYCCDMRGLRNERFAKSEVQYNPDLVSTNIVSNLSTFFTANVDLVHDRDYFFKARFKNWKKCHWQLFNL